MLPASKHSPVVGRDLYGLVSSIPMGTVLASRNYPRSKSEPATLFPIKRCELFCFVEAVCLLCTPGYWLWPVVLSGDSYHPAFNSFVLFTFTQTTIKRPLKSITSMFSAFILHIYVIVLIQTFLHFINNERQNRFSAVSL